MKRTWLRGALLALAAALLLPFAAYAAEPIVLTREVELTVRYQDGTGPLDGARFDLYRVADVSENGEFTLTGDFAGCPVELEGLDSSLWQALANTLAGYAAWSGAAPLDSGVTDQRGLLAFPTSGGKLFPGLYLVVGQRHTVGNYTYTPKPFLVCLPNREGDSQQWDYRVEAEPKFDREETPPEGGTVRRRVLKAWRDGEDGTARPQSVTVLLLRDGVVHDTVILSEANGWRYTWEELEADHTWTVVELPVEGYTVSVTQEGITFVVVNTHDGPDTPAHPDSPHTPDDPDTPNTPEGPDTPNTPDGPRLPQTGMLWWPVPVLLAAGLLLLVLGRLRRRGAGDAEKK